MEKENVGTNSGGSATKKRHLLLSLKKHSRFADVSEETVESFACASLPKNSALDGKWAVRNLSLKVVDCVHKCNESWISLTKEIGVVGVLNTHFAQNGAK